MSIFAMTPVWEADLKPSYKFVLLAYADSAKKDGTESWPGWDVLQQMTGYSRSQIGRITKDLVEMGILVQTKRGQTGQRAEYTIVLDHPVMTGAQDASRSTGSNPKPTGSKKDTTGSKPEPTGSTPVDPSRPIPPSSTSVQSSRPLSEADKSAPLTASQDDMHSDLAIIGNTTSIEKRRNYQTAMKDALVAGMGWNTKDVTQAQWGRIEAAAKQLRDIEADPAEVPHRCQVYRVNFNGATMTPNAVATNWADLAEVRVQVSKRDIERASNKAAIRAALEGLE